MASLTLNRLSGALKRAPLLLTRRYTAATVKPAWTPRQYIKVAPTVQKAHASTEASNEDEIEVPEGFESSSSEIPPLASDIAADNINWNGNVTEDDAIDWSKSYLGLATQAFNKEISAVLMAPIDPMDIEMKPDGLIYLPEIKYRRVLNKAFGPGGWGLAPRSETNVSPKTVSREYALICQGRLVSIARGEQEYFDPSGVPTAVEACKSNALMRCCKDLGVASELWDPRFIREFKAKYCVEVFAEHLPTKKKKKLWRRKDQPKFSYPFQE